MMRSASLAPGGTSEDISDVAVVILTLNESANLSRAVTSCGQLPVVVVDSGSTDETVSLALELGCNLLVHEWEGFAGQRNWARQVLDFPVLFFLDADEIMTPELVRTLLDPSGIPDGDVIWVDSRIVMAGRRLNHAPGYPLWHPRILRANGRLVESYSGHGEAPDPSLRTGRLPSDAYYLHDAFSDGIRSWMSKHVRLADAHVASQSLETGVAATTRAKVSALVPFTIFRVPARFVYHYAWKGGWRDGRRGLAFSLLYAWYEFTLWTLHRLSRGGVPK